MDSPWHWAIVAIVAFILFFGWKNLPDMSRSLGRSLRIFKTEIKGMNEDDKQRAEADTPKAIEASPPQAQVVKNPVAHTPAGSSSAPRPRPTPRPTADSTTSTERPVDR